MSDPVLLPTADAKHARGVLLRLLAGRRSLALLTTLVLVVGAGAGLATPLLLGAIVDEVIENRSQASIDGLVGALALAAVAFAALTGLGAYLVIRLGEQMLADLRERVLARALGLALKDVERAGTGDLVARVTGDVSAVSRAVRFALPELAASVLGIGFTVVALAVLDWRLALAGLAAAPIHVLSTRRYLRRTAPIYQQERVAEGARTQQLHESFAGARTVRAFGLSARHRELSRERSLAAMERTLSVAHARAFFYVRLNTGELLGLGTVLVVGYFSVRADAVTVGEATAAALAFHRLFDPVGAVLLLLDEAQSAGAAVARLIGISELEPEPDPGTRPRDASVCLDGVRFAYGTGDDVLRGVDLDVAPGERVALVGPSGAGKTTVARLIAGLAVPHTGAVRVGGVEVDGAATVRDSVRLITQDVHVFAGALADDLRLAAPEATEQELLAALRVVGAEPWVEALPDGLETVVGAGGHALSATQAQQVALARLVLTGAPVAVLDEATAEAGSAGARTLEGAADAALAGRTALVIAHRLTQARTADRIVVLEDGAVVESGDHDALVAADGRYAELWSAWSGSR